MEAPGANLDEWKPTVDSLDGRHMIHVYGESGTGKSYVIMNMLAVLQRYIPQIMVFSPTNEQNHVYDRNGEVPSVFIHSKVDADVLNRMWERQEVMRIAYDRANKLEVIRRLALRTGEPMYLKYYEQVGKGVDAYIASGGTATGPAPGTTLTTEVVISTFVRISKAVIAQHRDSLLKQNLTEDEQKTIKRLAFNPRMLLIFDDCTDQLKREKSDIMEKLFYQGRHNLITTIIACHSDKTFTPELKKQTFLTIFTAPGSAMAYFERASTCLDKAEKLQARRVAGEAFTSKKPNQKLVIDRVSKKYHKYTAEAGTVVFGSPEIRDYSEKIKRSEDEALRNNAFADKFR
mgnify:CR=1 FL=1